MKDGSTLNTPYDLKSIMQYYEYSFSSNGQKTIVPRNGEKLVPVFEKTDDQILTNYDIQAVKLLYKCSGGQLPDSFVFYLINDLTSEAKLYWLNGDQEVLYQTIFSRTTSKQQPSHIGHKWLVRTSDNAVMQFTIGEGQFAQSDASIKLSSLSNTVASTPAPITLAPGSPFQMKLYNDSFETLNLYWVNYNGEEQHHCSLIGKNTLDQATYTGHKWVLKGSFGTKKWTIGEGKFMNSGSQINVSGI